jgi:hypothetical protein
LVPVFGLFARCLFYSFVSWCFRHPHFATTGTDVFSLASRAACPFDSYSVLNLGPDSLLLPSCDPLPLFFFFAFPAVRHFSLVGQANAVLFGVGACAGQSWLGLHIQLLSDFGAEEGKGRIMATATASDDGRV